MRLVGCPREDWHPQTEQGMPGALQQNTAALPPQNQTIGPAEHRVSDRPDDKVTQGWRASSLTISEVPSVSPARFRHIRPIHVLASPALEIPRGLRSGAVRIDHSPSSPWGGAIVESGNLYMGFFPSACLF